ncbi:MAG: serine/threonine protein kinase [Candidatus Saccharimonas sp.]|nr:serine/threonine protein kinase [Planctomycetaceae bacterium]
MPSEPTHEFLTIAGQQGLLPTETLRDLSEEAIRRQVDPATLILQKGLLSPVQVEIVETLRQPADSIPGYEIQSVIGHGGMGVVYRARQLNLNRVVALKTILVNQAANPTMLARFEQEAQTVAKLLHPHIVAAYDFGRHVGRLYFAMEFVEGEDAEHYARREHPLSERVTWGLIRQAAAGLAHAAELGVVHRDIKPANLLLVTPPQGYPLPAGMPMVKIADFGLASLTQEADERTKLTAEHTTLGSPHYMAPEQLDASRPVDLRADIYSLGATAYHLLAGHPPFDNQTLPQIIAKKLSDERPVLPATRGDVSAEGLALLHAMLTRDPGERIGSYAELLARIDALPVVIASDSATLAWRSATVNAIPSIPKTSHRRSWIAAGIATLAALAVGVTVYALGLFSGGTGASPATATTSLANANWGAALFDGKSLRGWVTQRGSWNVVEDDEGSHVVAGTDGEILHPLTKAIGGKPTPIPNYRLLVTVRLHEASAVEMQFNVDSTGRRHALRLTLDRIAVGRRASGRSPLEPIEPAKPFEIGADRLHELKLERQAAEWRVFVDDVLAGTVPLAPQRELPEFRLVAEGGPAWFADMAVEELAP